MTTRSPRTILAFSAAMALTVAALAPTAAFARGPNGDGSATCDGDCTSDTPQLQVQARDGSGAARSNRTQVNTNTNGNRNTNTNGNRNTNAKTTVQAGRNANTTATARANGNGQNAKTGAGQGPNEDGERGPGTCDDCDAEMGVLTSDQEGGLLFMAEEEKLAHDLYAAFADMYGVRVFSNVSESEATHQEAVDVVIERYGLDASSLPTAAGAFENDLLQSLYDSLLEEGLDSLEAAIGVGVQIEETDIADLESRMAELETSAPDVYEMYSHLLAASQNHLESFEGWL